MPVGSRNAMSDLNSDDYVAQILTKEAQDSSLKYSALGMEAYVPRRPTGAAPKPNTRFLRHIIKETDSHNAALRRKEEREARERMRQLRTETSSSTRTSDKDSRHHRHHGLDSQQSGRERRDGREDRYRSHRRVHRSRSLSTDRDRSRKTRREYESRDSEDDRSRKSRHSRHRRYYSRSRSRSPRNGRSPDSRNHRRRVRRRSSSPSRSRSSGLNPRHEEKDSTVSHNPPSSRSQNNRSQLPEYESDPLEDLVGPLPPKESMPIRCRGRGAYKPSFSNIDSHFAADYDPTLDVQPEDDDLQTRTSSRRPVPGLMSGDDDWELALEALRDRARWKQRGEERLREAGFNNDVVQRWKNNNSSAVTDEDDGRLSDVKWSTKSEGREWDRGKFVDADGHIDVKATW